MSYKKGVLKNFAIFTGKHCASLFLSCYSIKKETLAQGFSCEFCNIFKNTFFTGPSGWLPLFQNSWLALYFAIIYRWQLSRSEKSLVGKKDSSIYDKDFTDLDFFFIFFLFFFHFLWQIPVYLVSYANCLLYSEQATVLLSRRYLNITILTNFEILNSISNILLETHDFLVLKDPIIICIYLRTTDRHFRDQGNVRHPTSKLL